MAKKRKRVKKWWMIQYVGGLWLGAPNPGGRLTYDAKEEHAAAWRSLRKARVALATELRISGNIRRDYRIVPLVAAEEVGQ